MSRKGAVRAARLVILFIMSEEMNSLIKIIKTLEDLSVLIDGVTETVKLEIRKQEGGFLRALPFFEFSQHL